MSEVKRYDLVGDMDGNCNINEARMEISDDGIYVKHKDYAALEAKCATLAAENAGLKDYLSPIGLKVEGTPVTDAFLAEIKRKEISKFINSIEHIMRDKLSPYDTEEMLEAMRIFLEEQGGE